MRLTKSFRLLRLLNAQPIWPLRVICAAGGWLAALIFTRRLTLAAHIARLFWQESTLKQPMRMLAWYGARSPLRLEPLADPVFDFARGLTPKEEIAVRAFLEKSKRTQLQQHLDDLTLAADITTPMAGPAFDAVLQRFEDTGAVIFDHLAAADPVPPPPPSASRAGDFAVADARRALAEFADLFPNDTVPWYIISGTFLGLTREGAFLAHDYDIDLGVHAEAVDLDAIAARATESADFALVANDALHLLARDADGTLRETALPILLKLVHRSGVHIDVFVHYLEDGVRWHGSHVHRWDNTEFALEPHTFEGVDVLAPANADLYLRENYGDWRTPVSDFSPSTGTPNLTVVHNLASIVLAIKRYALAQQAGDRLSNRLIETLIGAGYAKQTEAGIRLDLSRF